MRRAADEMGFSFSPKGETEIVAGNSWYLFSQGEAKTVLNVLSGATNDLEVRIFDFGYYTGGEESRDESMQSVICFRSPELDIPAFCVRPRSVFHTIASLFGYQDIQIDGHPYFSKHYLLRGNDEIGVRRLFNEDVVAYFERSSSFFAEGCDNQFIFYCWAKLVEPENIRFFVQEGFELLSLFWQTSSRRREELPNDLRQRFGVRVAGNVSAAPDRYSAGIRQAGE
jgi:hypothetical protein